MDSCHEGQARTGPETVLASERAWRDGRGRRGARVRPRLARWRLGLGVAREALVSLVLGQIWATSNASQGWPGRDSQEGQIVRRDAVVVVMGEQEDSGRQKPW